MVQTGQLNLIAAQRTVNDAFDRLLARLTDAAFLCEFVGRLR